MTLSDHVDHKKQRRQPKHLRTTLYFMCDLYLVFAMISVI